MLATGQTAAVHQYAVLTSPDFKVLCTEQAKGIEQRVARVVLSITIQYIVTATIKVRSSQPCGVQIESRHWRQRLGTSSEALFRRHEPNNETVAMSGRER